MAKRLYLFFLIFRLLKMLLQHESAFTQSWQCSQTFIRQWCSRREQFGVQYLVQGHFDMQTEEAEDQTTDPLISRRPAVPPEPQPPCCMSAG